MMSPAARRRAEVKERIIEQATLLIAERGYDGVALRDIARAAGIQLSKLSSHFPLKEDLREAVVQRAINMLVDRNSSLDLSDMAPREGLRRFIASTVELMLGDLPEMRVLDKEFYQNLNDDATVAMAIRTLQQPLVRGGDQNVARLMETSGSDLATRISPIRLTQLLFAIIYGVTRLARTHHYLVGKDSLTAKAITQDVTLIFERALGLEPASITGAPDPLEAPATPTEVAATPPARGRGRSTATERSRTARRGVPAQATNRPGKDWREEQRR